MLLWVMNLGFAGGGAAATPQVTPQTGRSRRRRYSVEIDGEFFVFDSILEIQAFLAETRETVEEDADKIVTTEVIPKPPRIEIRTRSGPTTSKVLRQEVRRTQQTINRAYARAAEAVRKRNEIDREISSLMLKKLRTEEETIIALLL